LDRPRQHVIDDLVAELGLTADAVDRADKEGAAGRDLQDAERSLTAATDLIAELTNASEADALTIAAAWEALAVAYDAACRARATTALARAQHQDILAQRRDLEQRRVRARDRAEQLRAWWSGHPAAKAVDDPSD
jgi:hypothetical protein